MNEREALHAVRGYARAGRVRYTAHARDRMRERNVRAADVIHALVSAGSARADGARWRVAGPDIDGDELVLVVAIDAGVVVVTLF